MLMSQQEALLSVSKDPYDFSVYFNKTSEQVAQLVSKDYRIEGTSSCVTIQATSGLIYFEYEYNKVVSLKFVHNVHVDGQQAYSLGHLMYNVYMEVNQDAFFYGYMGSMPIGGKIVVDTLSIGVFVFKITKNTDIMAMWLKNVGQRS